MESDLKLAVLIDGDNIPSSYVKEMMEEIAKYGNPTIKRIYGDWTIPHLSGWKAVLLDNAITPIQQYGYTQGKNSTDSAMIIDAMDVLYSGKVNGFCLVSSDSDFTRLAIRLREAGMIVYGIGQRKTPGAFISACDKFIYLEVLREETTKTETRTTRKHKPKDVDQVNEKVIRLISSSIDAAADEDGWAFLGDIGNLLLKKQPNFDPRNFGFQKLTPLISSTGRFEIEQREQARGKQKLIYVRNKD